MFRVSAGEVCAWARSPGLMILEKGRSTMKMKRILVSIVLVSVTSAGASGMVVRRQGYDIGMANMGLVMGMGTAQSMAGVHAAHRQCSPCGVQQQHAGIVGMGQAHGRCAMAGFMQAGQVTGGQIMRVTPQQRMMRQGVSLNAGQVLGKTGPGTGGAQGMVVAGAGQSQDMRTPRAVLGQSSRVNSFQGGSVHAGRGSTAIVGSSVQAQTHQVQRIVR